MLIAKLALLLHELHKFLFGQYFKKNFLQCAVSFSSIIIIEHSYCFVNTFAQLFRINIIVGDYIPFMRKKIFIRKPDNRIFRNTDIELFADLCNGAIHILYAEMLTNKT